MPPAFQITDRSEVTDKVIVPHPGPPRGQNLPPDPRHPHPGAQEHRNSTVVEETVFEKVLSYIDLKYLTTVILLIATIMVMLFYFPKVN